MQKTWRLWETSYGLFGYRSALGRVGFFLVLSLCYGAPCIMSDKYIIAYTIINPFYIEICLTKNICQTKLFLTIQRYRDICLTPYLALPKTPEKPPCLHVPSDVPVRDQNQRFYAGFLTTCCDTQRQKQKAPRW